MGGLVVEGSGGYPTDGVETGGHETAGVDAAGSGERGGGAGNSVAAFDFSSAERIAEAFITRV